MRWLRGGVLVPLAMLLAACAGTSGSRTTTDSSGKSAPVRLASPSVSSRATISPGVSAGVYVGPWGARTVGGVAGHDIPLAGDRDSLYLSDGTAILRLDPSSGDVLARRIVGAGVLPQAMIVGGALWIVRCGAAAKVIVRGLSLDTLTPVTSIRVPVTGAVPFDQVAFDAVRSAGRLYVGVENAVAVIDAQQRQIMHRYQVRGGLMADLAVSPDDSRLYVTLNVANSMVSRLEVLDPDTGAVTAAPIPLDGGTGFGGITASAGGIWLQTGSGMSDWLNFLPSSNLTRTSQPVTNAGGGLMTTSTVTRGVVWIGGMTKLACADPRTGSVRATVSVPTPHRDAANISRITVAGDHLFAYYVAGVGPSKLLITLHPPARCGT